MDSIQDQVVHVRQVSIVEWPAARDLVRLLNKPLDRLVSITISEFEVQFWEVVAESSHRFPTDLSSFRPPWAGRARRELHPAQRNEVVYTPPCHSGKDCS